MHTVPADRSEIPAGSEPANPLRRDTAGADPGGAASHIDADACGNATCVLAPASLSPRIAPVEEPYSEASAAWFARIMPAGVEPLLLFRTLAVNERVFGRVMAGGLLDRGSLTLRERELVIDRTTWRCGSEYEWGVHVAFFGARVGFGDDEIAGLCTDDVDATVFAPIEKLLLRLCDDLHATATVSEALWTELRAVYREEQLVELVVLAGLYHAISFATNAFALAPEAFGARFPH